MKHNWQNIDQDCMPAFVGTTGWYRCTVCGTRHHFPKNEIVETDDCDENQTSKTEALAERVTKLLHDNDADTTTIRVLLAAAIVKHKPDTPYKRDVRTPR